MSELQRQLVSKKEPWEAYPDVWKTKAAFFAWLRGCLRRAVWERYPGKILYKNSACSSPPIGYTGKAKSGAKCALSGEWTGKSMLEVDHKVGNISLRCWEDVLPFIQHLCGTEENFQLVSKEAHRIKSYADRKGISYEDAAIEKKVIEITKNKKMCLDILTEAGYSDVEVSNEKKRRTLVLKLLKERKDGLI